jgi:hypothetical protein
MEMNKKNRRRIGKKSDREEENRKKNGDAEVQLKKRKA